MTQAEDAIAVEAARRLADSLCDQGGQQGQDAMRVWRLLDPRHDARLTEMEALWRDMGTAVVPTPTPLPELAAPREPRRAMPRRTMRRWATGMAAAAAVVVAVLADLPMRLRADIRTDVGERQTHRLADGSRLWLDTDSAVAIEYAADRRRVRLLRGRAGFQVAPDRARPFTVGAGEGETTALGTRFLVALNGDGGDVTVTEHAVGVTLANGMSARVGEGQGVRYDAGGIGPVAAADAGAATAWTRGWMTFEDRPLGEVVADLARYHPGMMHVIGDDLAARRVSGAIAIDDPDQAVATLQALLHLRVTRLGSLAVFFHR